MRIRKQIGIKSMEVTFYIGGNLINFERSVKYLLEHGKNVYVSHGYETTGSIFKKVVLSSPIFR